MPKHQSLLYFLMSWEHRICVEFSFLMRRRDQAVTTSGETPGIHVRSVSLQLAFISVAFSSFSRSLSTFSSIPLTLCSPFLSHRCWESRVIPDSSQHTEMDRNMPPRQSFRLWSINIRPETLECLHFFLSIRSSPIKRGRIAVGTKAYQNEEEKGEKQ